MKKLLCFFLLTVVVTAVFAQSGRTFEKLGRFQNVEIKYITWKGIRITHSGSKGGCYITEKDLKPAERKLLEKELAIWRDKAEKHSKRSASSKSNRAEQEEELNAFLKKLPSMSTKDICAWFQLKIGTTPYNPNFKAAFFTAYGFAKNKQKVMNECEKRLKVLEKADFDVLKESCAAEPISAINGIMKKKIGVPFAVGKVIHPSFTENLRRRYPWINKNERAAFTRDLLNKLKKELVCCFCTKEESLKPGGYCKTCKPKVCTKCDKALAKGKRENNSDKNLCENCKLEEENMGDGGGDAGGGGGDAGGDAGGGGGDAGGDSNPFE